jgi:hypothetical protein
VQGIIGMALAEAVAFYALFLGKYPHPAGPAPVAGTDPFNRPAPCSPI